MAYYIPAIVLFPTPPLPLATASTFFTFGIGRFWIGAGLRSSVCAPGSERLGRPWYIHERRVEEEEEGLRVDFRGESRRTCSDDGRLRWFAFRFHDQLVTSTFSRYY